MMLSSAQARKMKLQSAKRPFDIDHASRVASEPTITGYRYPTAKFMDNLFGAEGRKDPRWFGHEWPPAADGGGDRPLRYRQDLVRHNVIAPISDAAGGDIQGHEYRYEPYASKFDSGARKPVQWFAPWSAIPDTSVGQPGPIPHAMEKIVGLNKPAYEDTHRPAGVWGKEE